MSLLRSSLEGSLAARFQANGPSLFLEELFVGSAFKWGVAYKKYPELDAALVVLNNVLSSAGRALASVLHRGVEDLARLEESSSGSVEQRYRKALQKAGIEISYPDPDKRIPRKRHLIKLEGKPLSEQIIED